LYAENGIRYTLDNYFEDELASGKVSFETFNVEDKNNATIVRKYNAYTLSIFISTMIGETEYIEPVVDIWFYVGDDQAFVEAVESMVEARLGVTS
jgi:hypothetical protein